MKKEKQKKFGRRTRLISIFKNQKYFQEHPSQL